MLPSRPKTFACKIIKIVTPNLQNNKGAKDPQIRPENVANKHNAVKIKNDIINLTIDDMDVDIHEDEVGTNYENKDKTRDIKISAANNISNSINKDKTINDTSVVNTNNKTKVKIEIEDDMERQASQHCADKISKNFNPKHEEIYVKKETPQLKDSEINTKQEHLKNVAVINVKTLAHEAKYLNEETVVKNEEVCIKEEVSETDMEAACLVQSEVMIEGQYSADKSHQDTNMQYHNCDVQTEIIAKYINERGISKKNNKDNSVTYSCDQCDFTTQFKINVNVHKLSRHGKTVYKCPKAKCDYQTGYQKYLRIHLNKSHSNHNCDVQTKRKELTCDKCDYKTQQRKILNVHKRRMHTEVTYSCNHCDYTSPFKHNLRNHKEASHAEDPPHKCSQCDYESPCEKLLNFHLKSKHNSGVTYSPANFSNQCAEYNYKAPKEAQNTDSSCDLITETMCDNIDDNTTHNTTFTNMDNDIKIKVEDMDEHIHDKPLPHEPQYINEDTFVKNEEVYIKEEVSETDMEAACLVECEVMIERQHSADKSHQDTNMQYHNCDIQTEVKVFNCDNCDYKTQQKKNLYAHKRRMHREVTYSCDQCDFYSRYKHNLKVHKLVRHRACHGEPECPQCKYKTANIKLLDCHLKTHTVVTYSCDQCDYTSHSKHNLRNHKEASHADPPHKCPRCDYETPCRKHLYSHLYSKHNSGVTYSPANFNNQSSEYNYKASKKAQNTDTSCDLITETICDNIDDNTTYNTTFTNMDNDIKIKVEDMDEHIHDKPLPHEPQYINEETVVKNEEVYIKEEVIETDMEAACLVQSEVMIEGQHSADKSHQDTNMQYHNCDVQTEIKVFKCDKCDFKTKQKRNLMQHVRRMHKEVTFSCDRCDYTTQFKIVLQVHKKTNHANAKTVHKCTECDYQTETKKCLDYHLKSSHNDGTVTYSCDNCDYKTHVEYNLNLHTQAHHAKKVHKCPQCDYKTGSKKYLSRHLKNKHIKKVTYSCDQCDYKSHIIASVRQHKEANHADPPHKCPQCDYQTPCRKHIYFHLKTKHNSGVTYSRANFSNQFSEYNFKAPKNEQNTGTNK